MRKVRRLPKALGQTLRIRNIAFIVTEARLVIGDTGILEKNTHVVQLTPGDLIIQYMILLCL